MKSMGQQELQFAIEAAIREAYKRAHEYVTVEHLLYALLAEPQARAIIHYCGGDVQALRKELEQYLASEVPTYPEGQQEDPKQSIAFRRVLERAILHVRSSSKEELDSGDVLVAMFIEIESLV